jgi:hypothetical protein
MHFFLREVSPQANQRPLPREFGILIRYYLMHNKEQSDYSVED